MSIVSVHGPTMLGQGGGSGGIPGDGDPFISAITPATLPASAGPTLITVTGSDFVAGSVIEVGATIHATTFVSATSLTTTYDPTFPGTVNVTVRNPNEEESNDFPFTVTDAIVEDPDADPTGYDPSDHTVDEVKEYADCHLDEVAAILAKEVAGKNRTTLVSYLESLLPFDPADYGVDEVKEYAEAYPEEAEPILAAEREGKNRSTLVSFLEGLIEASSEADTAE